MSRSSEKCPGDLEQPWQCSQSDHPECYLLFQVLFHAHPRLLKCTKPSRTFQRPAWSDSCLAMLSTCTSGARGTTTGTLLSKSPRFPWVSHLRVCTPSSLCLEHALTRSCSSFKFLLTVPQKYLILVSLPAYSGMSHNFPQGQFLQNVFWRWPCLNRLIILPTACLSSWTSLPLAIALTVSKVEFTGFNSARFFHQKKSIFTLLSTPLWELKTGSVLNLVIWTNAPRKVMRTHRSTSASALSVPFGTV